MAICHHHTARNQVEKRKRFLRIVTVRLCLQPIFDARPYLTKWWLRADYHLLIELFCSFTVVYLAAIFA